MRGLSGGRMGGHMLRLALLGLFAGGLLQAAQAASVYRCLDAQGHVAYQDRACAEVQRETQIALAPLPPSQPSPDYGHGARGRASGLGERGHATSQATSRGTARKAAAHEPASYECRAANGEVFYKHAACPKSIRVRAAARGGRRGQPTTTESIAVSSSALRARKHVGGLRLRRLVRGTIATIRCRPTSAISDAIPAGDSRTRSSRRGPARCRDFADM